MASKKKSGNISHAEMKFIDENIDRMTISELAESLNKHQPPIQRYIRSKDITNYKHSADDEKLVTKLHGRYYWPELKKQFTPEELSFLEFKWVDYYKQFAEDVTATEENEMLELIRISILINRLMKEQQDVDNNIKRLHSIIDLELSKPADRRNADIVDNAQSQIVGYMSSKSSFTREYDLFTKQIEKFTKDLKGTREARKRKADDATSNFNAYLRFLDEEGVRKREGDYMEMTAIAADKAVRNLSEYHTYADQVVDIPLLNSDTIKDKE
jgi:hypothetical protein